MLDCNATGTQHIQAFAKRTFQVFENDVHQKKYSFMSKNNLYIGWFVLASGDKQLI